MKYYLFCAFLTLLIFHKENQDEIGRKNQLINPQTPYYALEIDALPKFTVLLNGAKIVSHNERGALSSVYLLNKEILSKGEQILNVSISSNENLEESDRQYFKFKIFKYKDFDSADKQLVLDATPNFSAKTNKYNQSHPFVADIPYKITGWSNSTYLIEQDQKELLKEVIEFYKKTHDILNSGDSSKFLDLVSKRNEETAIAFYNNPGVLQEKEELAQRVKKAKGKMNLLEDFTLKFYGNGRIVTLENKDGDSPLYYSTEDYDDFFNIQLHRPKKRGSLEVIR